MGCAQSLLVASTTAGIVAYMYCAGLIVRAMCIGHVPQAAQHVAWFCAAQPFPCHSTLACVTDAQAWLLPFMGIDMVNSIMGAISGIH